MNDQNRSSMSPVAQRPEDENLGVAANLMYGLQHVLTMYGGIVAVPLIVAEAAGMSPSDTGLLVTACLFMGGVATLLQTLGLPFFGCRLPLVQGVSFAGVATMVSILHTGGGIAGVLGAVDDGHPLQPDSLGTRRARPARTTTIAFRGPAMAAPRPSGGWLRR